MDVLYDLRDTLRDTLRDHMLSVLAVAFIVITLLWIVYSLTTNLLPVWSARQELAAQVLAAQQNVRQGQQNQANSAQALQEQLASTQGQLNATTSSFLSETQAAAILDSLYRYAADSSVTIVGVQAQAVTEPAAPDALYNVQAFDVQVTGPVPQLLDFLGRFQESTWPGVAINNLKLAQGEGQSSLSLTLLLYTSPFAAGANPAGPAPAVAPDVSGAAAPNLVSPADLTALVNSLYEPWAAENWPEVIRILQQILVQTPTDNDMQTRLYAAYVNYGYQLDAAGQVEEAKAAFSNALSIRPDGIEALEALQRVNNGLPATAVSP